MKTTSKINKNEDDLKKNYLKINKNEDDLKKNQPLLAVT